MIINIIEDEPIALLEEQQRRQDICLSCPFYLSSKDTCSSCNCLVARKKMVLDDTCPEGNWS